MLRNLADNADWSPLFPIGRISLSGFQIKFLKERICCEFEKAEVKKKQKQKQTFEVLGVLATIAAALSQYNNPRVHRDIAESVLRATSSAIVGVVFQNRIARSPAVYLRWSDIRIIANQTVPRRLLLLSISPISFSFSQSAATRAVALRVESSRRLTSR